MTPSGRTEPDLRVRVESYNAGTYVYREEWDDGVCLGVQLLQQDGKWSEWQPEGSQWAVPTSPSAPRITPSGTLPPTGGGHVWSGTTTYPTMTTTAVNSSTTASQPQMVTFNQQMIEAMAAQQTEAQAAVPPKGLFKRKKKAA